MENQRVRLSKMLLKNALIKLLKEKPLEKITIYGLCAEAQLNRVTFYKYYGSQYDLLTDIFSEEERNELCLFFYQGGYAVIREWLNRVDRQSPKKMAAFLNGVIRKLTQ